jgi:hypothetical protein
MTICSMCGSEDAPKKYSVSDREDAIGEVILLCLSCAEEEQSERTRDSVGWCIEVS